MRELKFREWLPDLKRFHYWGMIDGGFVGPCEPKGKHGQMTTLKDKNGKEIYEGDVVRGIELGYENTGWENELRTGAVVFSKSGSWVYTVGSQEHQLLCYMKNPEILGNIYEHPELLSPAV